MPATNGFYSLSRCSAALIAALALPLTGWSKDAVQTYRIPKESAPALKTVEAAAAQSKPLTWTLPQGWQETAPSAMRLAQFSVPGPNGSKAECAITAFPGNVGGEPMNVNRWRGEVGLEPIEESAMTSEPVTVGTEKGKLYQFSGANNGICVAWVMKDGTSWFFKVRGDNAAVAQAKDSFIEFLKSVHFQGTPSMDAAQSIGQPGSMNPHSGLPDSGMPAMPAGHPPIAGGDTTEALPSGHPVVGGHTHSNAAPSSGIGMPGMGLALPAMGEPAPTLQVPSHWKEQPASAMVVKSYSIAADSGKATVAISTFPGQVGGTLANVNRWRGQIGLDPITEADLGKSTQSFDTADGKATLVDISGKDRASGKPVRMVAAMVSHGDATWFYKLLGDSPVVEREKENLTKMVQMAQYPQK